MINTNLILNIIKLKYTFYVEKKLSMLRTKYLKVKLSNLVK